MIVRVVESKTNTVLAQNVKVADSFWDRTMGLMFKKDLTGMDGLLLNPCNSIHTSFMRFSLDAIFLDKENKIVKIIRDMKPWRMTRMYFRANKVLEMKAGTFPIEINEGEQLEVINV
jgi:uncharacterized membrane protein (UPF0127 family)